MEFELFQFADLRQRFDDGQAVGDVPETLAKINFDSEDPVEFVDAQVARSSWAIVRDCTVGYEPECCDVGERVLAANLDQIARLRIEGVLDDSLIERLTKLQLPSLLALEVYGCGGCSPNAIASLAGAKFFPQLQELSLPDTRPEGVNALLAAVEERGRTLNGLRTLNIGDATVDELEFAQRIGLNGLERLKNLSIQTLQWLSEQPALASRLRALDCMVLEMRDGTGAGDLALRALCSGPFSQLEDVRLYFRELDDHRLLKEFGQSQFASSLTRLGLKECRLSDAGWKLLAESGLENLRELDVVGTEGTSAGAERLFQSSLVRRLRKLCMGHNRLDARSYAVLSQNLSPAVEELELTADGEAKDAVRHLLSEDRFEQLRSLQVPSYSGKARLDFAWFPQKVRDSLRQLLFGYGVVHARKSAAAFPQLESLHIGASLEKKAAVWNVILNCDQLKDLRLANAGAIDAKRMRQLVDAEFSKGLSNLDLSYSEIGDEGAEILAASGMTPIGLWIGDSGVSTEGANKILESSVSSRLNFLSLEDRPDDTSALPKHCYVVA